MEALMAGPDHVYDHERADREHDDDEEDLLQHATHTLQTADGIRVMPSLACCRGILVPPGSRRSALRTAGPRPSSATNMKASLKAQAARLTGTINVTLTTNRRPHADKEGKFVSLLICRNSWHTDLNSPG